MNWSAYTHLCNCPCLFHRHDTNMSYMKCLHTWRCLQLPLPVHGNWKKEACRSMRPICPIWIEVLTSLQLPLLFPGKWKKATQTWSQYVLYEFKCLHISLQLPCLFLESGMKPICLVWIEVLTHIFAIAPACSWLVEEAKTDMMPICLVWNACTLGCVWNVEQRQSAIDKYCLHIWGCLQLIQDGC